MDCCITSDLSPGSKHSERRELTKKFEALKKPPGFTGNAPGGPSRWSTERTGEWEPVASKGCRGSCLRSFYRRPVSTRHKISSLATGQRSSPVHDGPGGASRRQGDGSLVSLYDSRACRNFRTARSAPRRLGGANDLVSPLRPAMRVRFR